MGCQRGLVRWVSAIRIWLNKQIPLTSTAAAPKIPSIGLPLKNWQEEAPYGHSTGGPDVIADVASAWNVEFA